MHFPIIELSEERLDAGSRMSACDLYIDTAARAHTEAIGEEYTNEERLKLLRSKLLHKLLKGIAKVNARNATITFHDEKTINATITKTMREKLNDMLRRMDEGKHVDPDDLALAGNYWKDDISMFYLWGCCQTSGELVSNAGSLAGRTLYIGGVVDARN